MSNLRVVLDTSVLVSALIFPGSVPRQAFDRAFERGVVLTSIETLSEIEAVLRRPRFERYVEEPERAEFLANFIRDALPVPIVAVISDCRDPKDNKFLELAVSGKASCIVSGDDDLLVLNPFHGIPILTPRQFLDTADTL